MNAVQEKLFLELRQAKMETEILLNRKHNDDWFTSILLEEIADIETALKKIENGKFGFCELSGEFLPDDVVKMIPTIKSVQDSKNLALYCKKPLDSSFY